MNELQKAVEQPLLAFLGKYKGQIETILPKHMTPARVLKLIVGALNRNPALMQCTPMTVVNAVLTAATMGLEIRPGSAYLIPFKNNKNNRMECQLLIDYRGKIDLARRSGQVLNVEPEIVYGREKFAVVRDSIGKHIEHEPILFIRAEDGSMLPLTSEDQRGIPIGAYAIAFYREGPPSFVFMPALEIAAIRAKSRAKDSGPWVTHTMEMWKKTAIHRLCKLLPQTPELAKSQEIDDAAELEIPMEAIIDVDPEDDEQPILPRSAEAAQEVAVARLADLRRQETELLANRNADRSTLGPQAEPSDAPELTEEEMARQQAEIEAQQAPKPRRAMTLPGRKP